MFYLFVLRQKQIYFVLLCTIYSKYRLYLIQYMKYIHIGQTVGVIFWQFFYIFCQKRCLFWPSVCPLCWVLQLPAPPELVPWWMEKDGEQNQYLYPTVYIYKGLYRQNILSIQCLFHFVYGISNIFYIMKPIHYSVANPMP